MELPRRPASPVSAETPRAHPGSAPAPRGAGPRAGACGATGAGRSARCAAIPAPTSRERPSGRPSGGGQRGDGGVRVDPQPRRTRAEPARSPALGYLAYEGRRRPARGAGARHGPAGHRDTPPGSRRPSDTRALHLARPVGAPPRGSRPWCPPAQGGAGRVGPGGGAEGRGHPLPAPASTQPRAPDA